MARLVLFAMAEQVFAEEVLDAALEALRLQVVLVPLYHLLSLSRRCLPIWRGDAMSASADVDALNIFFPLELRPLAWGDLPPTRDPRSFLVAPRQDLRWKRFGDMCCTTHG